MPYKDMFFSFWSKGAMYEIHADRVVEVIRELVVLGYCIKGTEKRISRQDLPTPELPIRRILNKWSLS